MVKCPQCGNTKAVVEDNKVKCNVCGLNVTSKDIKDWEDRINGVNKNRKEVIKMNGSFTLLHSAVAKYQLKKVKQLLERGADPNAQNSNGDTALHVIASKSYIYEEKCLQIIKLLLDARANPNIKNKHGETPLSIAVLDSNSAAIIKLLLEAGADPNIICEDGHTPLHWAVYSGNYPKVKLLLEAGADPNIKSKYWGTPLDVAEKRFEYMIQHSYKKEKEKYKEIIKLLYQYTMR